MGAPRPPLDISSKEVCRLMRAWGWSFVAEGVKEATFKNGRNRLSIKRKERADADGPVEAARLAGVTLEQWLQGPETVTKPTGISDADLTWFIDHQGDLFEVGSPESRNYRRIRTALESQGLLKQYQTAATKATKTVVPDVVKEIQAPPPPPEPFAVEADMEGYISLTEALDIIGKKPTPISRTACEIIAALSLGDVVVEGTSGPNATGKLHDMMPDRAGKVGMPGLSMALKQMDNDGLIWREMPHAKRTNKIGLCMPVKLTQDEKVKYLRPDIVKADFFAQTAEPEPEPAPTPPQEEEPVAGEGVLDAPPSPAPSMTEMLGLDDPRYIEHMQAHEAMSLSNNGTGVAIDVLRERQAQLQAEIDSIQASIDILLKSTTAV